MAQTSDTPQAPAPANLLSRFVGVIFSPRQTYQGIVAAPRWLGMLLLIVVFMSVATFALLSTQVGRDAALEQQVSAMEGFGMTVSDEMYAQLEGRMAIAKYTGAASQLVVLPIIYLAMAGILIAIFNAAMGGDARFKQVFTVVVHAGAVSVAQQVFVMPLNYYRGSLTSPTNLAAMLPMLPEKSFLTHVLGTIDIFLIWWLLVLAIGLAVLYRRKTQTVAVILFVIYGVIALGYAGVRSMF